MSNFEIALYILWTIAFAGWIISFVLHIKHGNKATQMLICSTIMLVFSIANLIV